MNIGIIGFGEIGKGLFSVYQQNGIDAKIYDPYLDLNVKLSDIDILNICIPYSEKFVDIVNEYIYEINPKFTVIHSTVAPGTTKKISGKVCHSPVRGLHPNLDTGIITFLKYIGSEDITISQEYQNHLEMIGIKSHICKNSITTEFAKIIDTTYYGLCIAFHNDVNNICVENNILFDEVMTLYNQTYNEGYQLLGKTNVTRPVLLPGNKIGGHCVIPNAKILKDYIDSDLIKGILKYS